LHVSHNGPATGLAIGRRRARLTHPSERDARPRGLARSMRRGDVGEEAHFEDGGVRASVESRYGLWTRLLGCVKLRCMACFDAFSCCASSAPSPPLMRRVTTQTSVERLLPGQDLGDAVVLASSPALMRAPSLPLASRSPEQHPFPRTCVEEAELEAELDLSPKKRAAVEPSEECPLCLDVRLSSCSRCGVAR
jgi:hypothetical protein